MKTPIKFCIVACVLFFLPLSFSAFAHPGGTDYRGGHYDRSTGEYHYHHGHPAHSHPDGVCPYDSETPDSFFRTDSSPVSTDSETEEKEWFLFKPVKILWFDISLIYLLIFGAYILFYFIKFLVGRFAYLKGNFSNRRKIMQPDTQLAPADSPGSRRPPFLIPFLCFAAAIMVLIVLMTVLLADKEQQINEVKRKNAALLAENSTLEQQKRTFIVGGSEI